MNNTVFSVSIPRSGHGLIVKCLKDYFRENFRYRENIKGLSLEGMGAYDLVKTHDFGLKRPWPVNRFKGFPIRKDYVYLIQVRDPLASLISDFELHVRDELKRPPEYQDWVTYSKKGMAYRKRFFKKWLYATTLTTNSTIVSYENLVTRPFDVLNQVLHRLFKVQRIREEALERIVEKRKIENRRKIGDFQFYDDDYFSRLIDQLGDVRKTLVNLKKFKLANSWL